MNVIKTICQSAPWPDHKQLEHAQPNNANQQQQAQHADANLQQQLQQDRGNLQQQLQQDDGNLQQQAQPVEDAQLEQQEKCQIFHQISMRQKRCWVITNVW